MRTLATTLFALTALPLVAQAQPVVDGNLNDAQYTTIATGGSGTSFGAAINVAEIKYYVDQPNSRLYIGVVGILDTGSNNGIGLWLGTGAQSGVAAGSALGVNGNGHYMSGNSGANTNFRSDFEVDYMFAVNPGSSANAYLDAARRWGGTTGSYIGNSGGANGTPATGTGPVGGSITFAFDNGGGTKGLEISMPLSELGATTSSAITAFAVVVSQSAYFSDDTVPGAPPVAVKGLDGPVPFGIQASPGFDADFSTLGGGPYNSGSASLPVELVSFSGLGTTSGARLSWTTASETNNAGFYVEQQTGSGWNTVSSLVAGRGTTTERSDYAYTVNGLTAGSYTFRLRQVDTDGSVHYSPNATVEVGVDGEARLTLLGQRAVRIETNDAAAMTLRVVDVLGRVVATRSVSVDGTTVVELPGLAAGAYVVRVDGDRFAGSKTLVVQ